jgi:outer membrane protein OmpA-like peptidoglycan-associated protein
MKKILLVSLFAVLGLSACATDDPHQRAKTGAAIGAVAGAVLGHQMDHDSGRFVGAVIGGMAGAAIGDYMDKQQQELERELAEEQRRHDLEISRLKDESLKIEVASEVSFDFDSAMIKPGFHTTLDKVAGVLARYPRTVVHVLGHTDSVGSESYNQQLSLRRADSVAAYLSARGISRDRLRTEGRGEMEPRASNETEAGRQLNRRVDIVVKPVVQGQEYKAYEPPPPSTRPASW